MIDLLNNPVSLQPWLNDSIPVERLNPLPWERTGDFDKLAEGARNEVTAHAPWLQRRLLGWFLRVVFFI
jgi:hypothetical protein